MNLTEPIQSRRERAALSPAEKNRQAFGRFVDDIRRCKALYPTQRDVAWLLAMATLREGFNSVAFASLNELTCLDARRAPFAGLGANDLSLAVMGGMRGDKVVQGLKHFGIVVVDERSPIEAAMPLTVWMLVTDVRQWALPADGWRFGTPELSEWQMHLRACRRRHTLALGALSVEPDLHDARADVKPMAHSDARNALTSDGSETATDGRRPLSVANAPVVPPMAGQGASAPRYSESRNADLPAKARCVPTVGTPSRARLSKLDSKSGHKTGQNNPIWMDRFKREELKEKIQGDEREFRYAAAQIISLADWDDRSSGYAPNGVRWMKRWKAGGEHRAKAVAVFAEILTSDFKAKQSVAQAAQNLWVQFGGASLDAARLKK